MINLNIHLKIASYLVYFTYLKKNLVISKTFLIYQ